MSHGVTIARALIAARDGGVDRLDAQLMLGKLLRQPRAWLVTHDDALLSAAQSDQFAQWIERRRAGEPLAYLLDEQHFCGLALQVGPQVLIPRPETELLVDWGLELLAHRPPTRPAPQVIDLGCGSGAIALAIRHRCATAEVTGVDASAAALDIARRNAKSLGLPITLKQSDWWSAVAGQRFDLALANPPYVAAGDPHLDALQHEPPNALVAGEHGLSDLHRIIDGSPAGLRPGGWLLLEHGHDQGVSVRSRLAQTGFAEVRTRRDLAGLERCTGGHWVPA